MLGPILCAVHSHVLRCVYFCSLLHAFWPGSSTSSSAASAPLSFGDYGTSWSASALMPLPIHWKDGSSKQQTILVSKMRRCTLQVASFKTSTKHETKAQQSYKRSQVVLAITVRGQACRGDQMKSWCAHGHDKLSEHRCQIHPPSPTSPSRQD